MPNYTTYKRQLAVLDAQNDDIEAWITVRGNHIPIKKGESKEDAVKSFFEKKSDVSGGKEESGSKKDVDSGKNGGKVYKNTMSKVRGFKAKEDGTFDFVTGKPKNYSDGYSVSFHQNEPDANGKYKSDYGRYTEEEYDKNVADMVKESGGELNIGYFAGTPEVSVWVKGIKEAKRLMVKHNQHSIWDWKSGDVILNPHYDPKKNPMKE